MRMFYFVATNEEIGGECFFVGDKMFYRELWDSDLDQDTDGSRPFKTADLGSPHHHAHWPACNTGFLLFTEAAVALDRLTEIVSNIIYAPV